MIFLLLGAVKAMPVSGKLLRHGVAYASWRTRDGGLSPHHLRSRNDLVSFPVFVASIPLDDDYLNAAREVVDCDESSVPQACPLLLEDESSGFGVFYRRSAHQTTGCQHYR